MLRDVPAPDAVAATAAAPGVLPIRSLSDVVCEYPLKEMLDYHRARGAEATILVTKVRNSSKHTPPPAAAAATAAQHI
jgi:mannose-1-phosphate guanylyltransferase